MVTSSQTSDVQATGETTRSPALSRTELGMLRQGSGVRAVFATFLNGLNFFPRSTKSYTQEGLAGKFHWVQNKSF